MRIKKIILSIVGLMIMGESGAMVGVTASVSASGNARRRRSGGGEVRRDSSRPDYYSTQDRDYAFVCVDAVRVRNVGREKGIEVYILYPEKKNYEKYLIKRGTSLSEIIGRFKSGSKYTICKKCGDMRAYLDITIPEDLGQKIELRVELFKKRKDEELEEITGWDPFAKKESIEQDDIDLREAEVYLAAAASIILSGAPDNQIDALQKQIKELLYFDDSDYQIQKLNGKEELKIIVDSKTSLPKEITVHKFMSDEEIKTKLKEKCKLLGQLYKKSFVSKEAPILQINEKDDISEVQSKSNFLMRASAAVGSTLIGTYYQKLREDTKTKLSETFGSRFDIDALTIECMRSFLEGYNGAKVEPATTGDKGSRGSDVIAN